jgi:predicted permease
MFNLFSDLKHGTRSLLKNWRWTALAVVSLAVGIGVNAGMLDFVSRYADKLPVPRPDELVTFRFGSPKATIEDGNRVFTSFAVFERMRAENRTLTELFAFTTTANCDVGMGMDCPGTENLVVAGHGEAASVQYVSGNYFAGLEIGALRGRTLNTADDTPSAEAVAVIGYDYWRSRFGSEPATVGASFVLNGNPVRIVGVLPKGVKNPVDLGGRMPDIMLPLVVARRAAERARQAMAASEAFDGNPMLKQPDTAWLAIIGRRKPGVTTAQVQANLSHVATRARREEWETFFSTLAPRELATPVIRNWKSLLTKEWPRAPFVSASRGIFDPYPPIVRNNILLAAICLIFLFIVCMNVTNLQLARTAARQAELGVRASMGASRLRLVSQLLTESYLLASLAGLGGIWIAQWPALLNRLIPEGFPTPSFDPPSPFDLRLIAVTLGLVIVTGFVAGIGPMWFALNIGRQPTRKRTKPFGGSRSVMTRALLIAQVSLSIVLLIVGSLFLKSVHNLREMDLGFNPDNVAVFTVHPSANGYSAVRTNQVYDQIMARLSTVPGVKSVAFSDHLLFAAETGVQSPRLRNKLAAPVTRRGVVHPNFFTTMEIPLRRGRLFTDRDGRAAPRVAVVNETFVKTFLPDINPIGAAVRYGPNDRQSESVEIVGVVRDVTTERDVSKPVSPMLYTTSLQENVGRANFEVRMAVNLSTGLPAIRKAVQAVDPSLPIFGLLRYRSVVDLKILGDQIIFGPMTQTLAVCSLTFAMIGLFSLMSYVVTRRSKEIGIRMAVGAQKRNVVLAIMRETLVLVVTGVLVGVVFALALTPLVANQLVGLHSQDPVTIVLVVLLTLAVGAAAGAFPARHAASVDPMVALRHE